MGHIICVTGVSGSGKSSLVSQTISPILTRQVNNYKNKIFTGEKIVGIENIDKVISIDQSPIGRTSRSNPVTYTDILYNQGNFFLLYRFLK